MFGLFLVLNNHRLVGSKLTKILMKSFVVCVKDFPCYCVNRDLGSGPCLTANVDFAFNPVSEIISAIKLTPFPANFNKSSNASVRSGHMRQREDFRILGIFALP